MYRTLPRLIRSTLRNYYTVKPNLKKPKSDLAKELYTKIKATGPIPIADYMREALASPAAGYYTTKPEVIGDAGDFVTSPELSQIFGEMVAVWLLNEWSKIGAPKPLQLVELGPGKGSLTQDLLRVFKHFDSLRQIDVRLVEISPVLCDAQSRRLCATTTQMHDNSDSAYRKGMTIIGNVPIRWYRDLSEVPRGIFTLIIANEFFDALPIHKFQKTPNGYREVLIDIDPNLTEPRFRYVLAKEDSPMSQVFTKAPEEVRKDFEVSPRSVLIVKELAERLESDGGFALIADYGHDGDGTDTFRAYRGHQQCNPLERPGSADLTADVDFKMLRKAATEEGRVLAFGPTTQREFLTKMGIEHRYKTLKETANEEQLKTLDFGYDMLLNDEKMGKRFKFMCLAPAVLEEFLKKVPIVGF